MRMLGRRHRHWCRYGCCKEDWRANVTRRAKRREKREWQRETRA